MNYVEMIDDMTDRGWVVTIQPTLDGTEFQVRSECRPAITVTSVRGTLEVAVASAHGLTVAIDGEKGRG